MGKGLYIRKNKDGSLKSPTMPHGVHQASKNGFYQTQIYFHYFGIHVTNLKSARHGVQHRNAFFEVKHLVQEQLNKKLIASGSHADRDDFVSAMMAAVKQVRASRSRLGKWQFYSKVEMPGKQKAIRSNMTASLNAALAGWSRICKSQQIDDISALACLDEQRKAADDFSAQALGKLRQGQFPDTKTALSALRLWGFAKNTSRVNLTPIGKEWVHSDHLGIIKDRRDGKLKMSQASKAGPNFQRMLTQWLRGRMPMNRRTEQVPYTTISVNKGYAARLHRDSNNVGPSFGIALGDFAEGGGLRYYPDDDKIADLQMISKKTSIVLDMKNKPAVFDGNNGHCVEPFEGERFSLIFFTTRGWKSVSNADRRLAKLSGSDWPTLGNLQYLRRLLPPSKDSSVDKTPGWMFRSKTVPWKKTLKTGKTSKQIKLGR